MSKNKHKSYPFPAWLQSSIERNAGKPPVWKFPPIPKMEEGIYFIPLTFQNRVDFLELFEKDTDEWVDKRFRKAKSVYEYVGLLQIVMPYSVKLGGMDWLVYQEDDCIGILHAFEFSKEGGEFTQRRCSIGYAFGKAVRGSGIPQKVVRHFQDYLFSKINLLYLTASVKRENIRSIRFLKGLGYTEYPFYEQWETEEDRKVSDTIEFDLFRSKRTQNKVNANRKKAAEEYATWEARWVN